MILPHYFRIIPRIVLILLIIAAFGVALSRGVKNNKVLGLSTKQIDLNNSTIDREAVNAEIKKTIEVIHARPDYAGAWLRLSVLYGELGEDTLSKNALETAKNLNPDL